MTTLRVRASGDQRHRLLAAVTTAQLVLVVDAVSVEVALVPLGRDLTLGAAGLAWVINGYTLAFGGLLLVGGRVADVWGRARAFRAGLVVFGVAALLSAIATVPELLLVARVLQGAAAAFLAPASLSLLAVGMPSQADRLRGVARIGVVSAIGGSVAVVTAGLVTEHASWRWAFVVSGALALVVGVVLGRRLPPDAEPTAQRSFGLSSAAAATLALGSAIYCFQHASALPWAAWAFVVLTFVALVVVERRSSDPLLPRGTATTRGRPVAMSMLVVSNTVSGGAFFVLALTMQGPWGWSAAEAGAAFVPFGLALLAGSWIGSRLLVRVGERNVIRGGAALMVGALTLLATGPAEGSRALVFVALALLAFGGALTTLTLSVVVLHGAADGDAGAAGALLSVAQQLGIALGVAIVSITLPQLGWREVLVGGAVLAGAGLTTLSLRLPGRKDVGDAHVVPVEAS